MPAAWPLPRLRRVLCALVVGAATTGLTACGGNGGGDANGSDNATRTITDARGTKVEVPVLPSASSR